MVKRRRHPLLRPLPISPRIRLHTRFILFLRMGKRKRGRQIRPSSSMRKVEAVSMSGKCKVQLDAADPIQGAGGPGQVSVSNLEGTHRCPSSRPPLDLLNIPDEFKSLETDRLLPCDFKNASSSAMEQYDAYLQWFYNSHRGPVPVGSLVDIASKCLEKQGSMTSLWVDSHAYSNARDSPLAYCIYRNMDTVIQEKGEIEHPLAFDAAECLTKETELICEWLRHGRNVFKDDEEYNLCHEIRTAAIELFITRQKPSFHVSAALLGIRKEAEWLIENLKCNSRKSISTSMKIRQFALDFMLEKFNGLEPYNVWQNLKLSEVETAFESDDDESDDDESSDDESDDVADHNNYERYCYDEFYG